MVERTRAYIAGFLDADGSIFCQLVPRKGYKYGYQVRASIVFFQKSSQKRILHWLIHKLRVGYLRDRPDGLSEYIIVGFKSVPHVLDLIEPYLLLKRKQASLVRNIISRFGCIKRITPGFLLRVSKEVDKFGKLNYSQKRVNNTARVREFLSKVESRKRRSIPVSTDSR